MGDRSPAADRQLSAALTPSSSPLLQGSPARNYTTVQSWAGVNVERQNGTFTRFFGQVSLESYPLGRDSAHLPRCIHERYKTVGVPQEALYPFLSSYRQIADAHHLCLRVRA